eukprot:11097590-Lingulodinium_polyedra.AAC.1
MAIAVAAKLGYPLYIVEADIKWCFDEMRRDKVIERLMRRRCPRRLLRAWPRSVRASSRRP